MAGKGISIREFAKRDGCANTVVHEALEAGRLCTLPNGRMDPALVGTGWRARNRQKVGPVELKPDETPDEASTRIVYEEGRAPYTLAEAERIKENYLALLRQLEYDQKSGAVVAIEDVAMRVAGEYAVVRSKVLGISSKLAPRLAVLRSAEECKHLLDAEHTALLEDLTLDRGGNDPPGGDVR